MMKNTVIKWLLIVFAIANFVDIVTAFFIRSAEANPIFLLTGSFFIFLVLKFGLVAGAWSIAKKEQYPSHFTYYFFLSSLLLGCLLMTLGAMSNIYGILNPSVVSESAGASTSEKLNGYFLFALLIYMIPLSFSLACFKLYEKSKKWIKVKR